MNLKGDGWSVPKGLGPNRHFRAFLLGWCRGKPVRQRAVRERCKRDLVFYVDAFVWQTNPKKIDREIGPFVLYPFQERALKKTFRRLFEDQDDILWEKSRYQGATWMALILLDWMAVFRTHKKFLCISHSEAAVYKPGDPDSLFWKLSFMHDRMPRWLTGEIRRTKLAFSYPTGSSITGAATTERSGVGGRATAVLLDEFSKQRQDREILGQTADTGPRLFIGTHYGTGGAFYDLTQRPDLVKVVMHWSEHPEQARGLYRFRVEDNRLDILDPTYPFPADYEFVRTGQPTGGPFPGVRSPWYDRECLRRDNVRDVAMHLDINPAGSASQFFEPLTLRRLITEFGMPPLWEGDLRYDPDTGEPQALVPMAGGPLRLWRLPAGRCAVPAGRYAAGCDISTGGGRTPSVCSIADARTGEKVAEFMTNLLTPDRFAVAVVAACRLFQDENRLGALLVWEANGPGGAFGKFVQMMGYKRLFYRDTVTLARTYQPSDTPGWASNPTTKRLLLESYRAALYEKAFVNRSEAALEECNHYRYSDRKDAVEHPRDSGGDDPATTRSNHGDRVIADALAWLGCQRLGAGKPVAPEDRPQEAPVGSFLWRVGLHQLWDRSVQDRRPIRWAGRPQRNLWRVDGGAPN